MGEVSMKLVPFLQSFVLRTVCALSGSGGASEDCSSLRPCEASPGPLCLAGSQSHSPGDSRCSPCGAAGLSCRLGLLCRCLPARAAPPC